MREEGEKGKGGVVLALAIAGRHLTSDCIHMISYCVQ